jgi:hypothetical protein
MAPTASAGCAVCSGCIQLTPAKIIGKKGVKFQNRRKRSCTFVKQAAYFLGSFLCLLKIQPLVLLVSSRKGKFNVFRHCSTVYVRTGIFGTAFDMP